MPNPPPPTKLTPALCCAARAFLRWSQHDLAEASGVYHVTIRLYEKEQRPPIRATVKALQDAFEREGFVFVAEGGEFGFRWRKR